MNHYPKKIGWEFAFISIYYRLWILLSIPQLLVNNILSRHGRAGTVISEGWEDGQAFKDIQVQLVCFSLNFSLYLYGFIGDV